MHKSAPLTVKASTYLGNDVFTPGDCHGSNSSCGFANDRFS
jgi:hypothetical protein